MAVVSPDLFVLVLRVLLGLLLAGHGAQKVFGAFEGPGLEGFRARVANIGFPARPFAELAAFGELVGGLALAVGLLTPIACAVLAVDMLVAILKVHGPKGLWVTKGGYEYPLTLLVIFALIGLTGPGRYAIDAALALMPSPPIFVLVFIVGTAIVLAASRRRAAAAEQGRGKTVA